MQEGLQKAYEARMGLIAQQQDLRCVAHRRVMHCEETELVKEEFDSIEEIAMLAEALVWQASQLKCGTRMKASH